MARGKHYSADRLRKDWLTLGLSSGLFSLVAKKTAPEASIRKYEDRLNRLTVNQLKIFGHIFTHSSSEVRVKQIAHDLDITPAAASQAVERLVSVGLLDRNTDPKDRRSVIITISTTGMDFLTEYRTISNALLGSIYDELDASPEELDTFSKVLSEIFEKLEARWFAYLKSKRQVGK